MELIRQMAREVLEDAATPDQAVRIFMGRLAADPVLREQMVKPLLDAAVREAVNMEWRACRGSLVKGALHPMATDLHAGLMEAVAKSLFDYPLGGGKTIGQSTRKEIEEWAKHQMSRGRTEYRDGTWASLVAALLKRPNEKPVEHLVQADLERCMRRAERQVEKKLGREGQTSSDTQKPDADAPQPALDAAPPA